MSSGGGPSETTSTNINTNIPTYAQPFVMNMLGKGEALTNPNTNPYQQYQGQGLQGTQIAGFNPTQNEAFSNISGMHPSSQNAQATGIAGLTALNAMDPSQYQQGIGSYMSPYTQNVIKNQEEGAIRDYGRSLPQLGSAAAQVGGLGGSRSALMQSEANRNLQNQLAGIDATGYQNAYTNAQGAYTGQQNAALQGAQQLGQLGQQDYQQQAGINTAKLGIGNQQQGLQQNLYNTQYQNFLNQQNYPYAQMSYMSGLLRGTSPASLGNQYSQQNTAANGPVLGQIGAGLGSLFGAGA
jgi:hypothetical protein